MNKHVIRVSLNFNQTLSRWQIETEDHFSVSGKRKKPIVFCSSQNEQQARSSCNASRILGVLRKKMPFASNIELHFENDLVSSDAVLPSSGIQNGSDAGFGPARVADQNLRATVPRVWAKFVLAHPEQTVGFSHRQRLDKGTRNIGCEPDGGIIFDPSGNPVIAFESKKQGTVGNAIERWYKNFRFLTHHNRNLHYVTTLIGEGATVSDTGKPHGALAMFIDELEMQSVERGSLQSLNTANGAGVSVFANREPFPSESLDLIIWQVLEKFFSL